MVIVWLVAFEASGACLVVVSVEFLGSFSGHCSARRGPRPTTQGRLKPDTVRSPSMTPA